ncbi:hypothetical protein FOZ60_004613 [Perkinsus olseni]|uniref:Uncharacterized protein n=1 Tax=Perkinsus olseni TaxID=32597 RepID=A0A7J6NT67_PEROL|nr:hypothetical protein FOZ60_004613 [Perkinsus olseni]
MGLRFNWLHRSIVLFCYTAVMVLSDSVTPTMIGDHPPGCNGGTGFPITPHLHSIEGSCIYLTGAVNSNGVEPLGIGIRLKSNLPGEELGEHGTLELHWTVADPDAKPNIDSTGYVQLSLGDDEVYMRLTLTSPRITTTGYDGWSAMSLDSYLLAHFYDSAPENAFVYTPSYHIKGLTSTHSVELHSSEVKSEAADSSANAYSTGQDFYIVKTIDNGFQVQLGFWAEGTYETREGVQRHFGMGRPIIEGVMWY